MNPDSSTDDVPEYPDLPDGAQSSPEWREADTLKRHAELMQGRLALGCCMFWLDNGGYLVTGLPPMGDVCGGHRWMVVYTAEHYIRIQGDNLHQLAWAMKLQRIDDLRVTDDPPDGVVDDSAWVITSITATERSED